MGALGGLSARAARRENGGARPTVAAGGTCLDNPPMSTPRSLPVLMPRMGDQRWSCQSCTKCCRDLVVHLFEQDRERIDKHGWRDRLQVAPYVRLGRGWVLNKREDGACVFLDENGLCSIHVQQGADAKPFACRLYPFSVRPVRHGWQVSLRFDCPSAAASKGESLDRAGVWLGQLLNKHEMPHRFHKDSADFRRGLPATPEEIDALQTRLLRWVKDSSRSMNDRLIGAARLTTTLTEAKLEKIRGPRFAELLDLLFRALPTEIASASEPPHSRQRGMLRQLAFAHAEHLNLAQMRAGLVTQWHHRWRQLRYARRFRKGVGLVPRPPNATRDPTFADVESVGPAREQVQEIESLLLRYVLGRLTGQSVFGEGYYGWPILTGLPALWLSIATAGWWARYHAAADDRPVISLADVATAIGMVDRAASRLPILGAMPERIRINYLLRDDGVARLVCAYSFLDDTK